MLTAPTPTAPVWRAGVRTLPRRATHLVRDGCEAARRPQWTALVARRSGVLREYPHRLSPADCRASYTLARRVPPTRWASRMAGWELGHSYWAAPGAAAVVWPAVPAPRVPDHGHPAAVPLAIRASARSQLSRSPQVGESLHATPSSFPDRAVASTVVRTSARMSK